MRLIALAIKLKANYMEMKTIQALTELKDGKLTANASTENEDRVGDTLKIKDWDFSNFKKNPVLLAGHDYRPQFVIGVAKNLRVEGKNIWVWDYKPNANKEKYAPTQIFFYAYMLSRRTGIPLENFRCGYFDHKFAFAYKPERELILKLNKQRILV